MAKESSPAYSPSDSIVRQSELPLYPQYADSLVVQRDASQMSPQVDNRLSWYQLAIPQLDLLHDVIFSTSSGNVIFSLRGEGIMGAVRRLNDLFSDQGGSKEKQQERLEDFSYRSLLLGYTPDLAAWKERAERLTAIEKNFIQELDMKHKKQRQKVRESSSKEALLVAAD